MTIFNGPQEPHPENRQHASSEPSSNTRAVADGLSNPSGDGLPAVQRANGIIVTNRNFPPSLGDDVDLFQGRDGYAYIRRRHDPRLPVLRVGTKASDAYLRGLAREKDKFPSANDLRELNEYLSAHAELSGDVRDVWYRVAPILGGCEIDRGDSAYVRDRLTSGRVEILREGSDVLFYRTSTMRPLPTPAEQGDLTRLGRYLNVDLADQCLLRGWISYTLAHAKVPTTKFPILLLHGDQGTGKSFLCGVVQTLVDPNEVLLRSLPRSEQDLAIAAQHAHVLIYDNVRELKPWMSDKLCIASTGGTFSTRRLYSDADQLALRLHVALVLNGIVPFADQPDLAQRCVPLSLRQMDEGDRKDEAALVRDLQTDLPAIFRGLLDLIARVLEHLGATEVTNPERMIDFVHWLAALEKAEGVPAGVYQAQYSQALSAGMLESLEANPLAAAVIALIEEEVDGRWSGTPSELYERLDRAVGRRASYSRDWPPNPIAMSKRLQALQAGLRRQGVEVRIGRGHKRRITITRLGGPEHE